MCRTALAHSEEGAAMAEKFNKGIVFLLGASFSVAAGVGVAMRRSRRRIERAEGSCSIESPLTVSVEFLEGC